MTKKTLIKIPNKRKKKKKTKRTILYENKDIVICIFITAVVTTALLNAQPTQKDSPEIAEELGYDECKTIWRGIMCKNETHVIYLGTTYGEYYIKDVIEVVKQDYVIDEPLYIPKDILEKKKSINVY